MNAATNEMAADVYIGRGGAGRRRRVLLDVDEHEREEMQAPAERRVDQQRVDVGDRERADACKTDTGTGLSRKTSWRLVATWLSASTLPMRKKTISARNSTIAAFTAAAASALTIDTATTSAIGEMAVRKRSA